MSLHGGDIWHLKASHGLDPDAVLDFSSSLNPLGLPDSVRRLLVGQPDLARRYPDTDYSGLRQGLATWLGLSAEHIAVGNGASELIREVLLVLKPRRIMVCCPGFAEYSRAACKLGIELALHQLDVRNDFRIEVAALCSDIVARRPDMVFICNPNNPSSTQLTAKELGAILETCAEAGTWLVMDETFIELSRQGNAASLVPRLCGDRQRSGPGSRLIVLRALTKIFALAGLRIGYLAAAPELASRIRHSLVPWSVNGFAAALGSIFVDEADYLVRTGHWMAGEPDWLFEQLSALSAARVNSCLDRFWRPDSNFILGRLKPGFKAAGLRETMLLQGILIRDCGNFAGLGPEYFRVAVRNRADNERLLGALP